MTTDLTRDRIMELKAGPSLDALIAEHVMGWQRMKDNQGYVDLIEPRMRDFMMKRHGFESTKEPLSGADVPRYSTSIQDAFKVVEKMRESGLEVTIDAAEIGDWWAGFSNPQDPHYSASAERSSLPESICVAALLAKLR